jgi:hypothetical protein
MQHRAGAAGSHDFHMQERFGGHSADAADRRGAVVHLENAIRGELAFERRTWRDRQSQRLAFDNGAEVPACAQHPPELVESTPGADELLRQILKRGRPAGYDRGHAPIIVLRSATLPSGRST